MQFPKSLSDKLRSRREDNAFRKVSSARLQVDFSSNDYLGFARSAAIFNATHQFLLEKQTLANGATGSRLISGNHALYDQAEALIADFHQSESALIFNSGYDANVGFFSSVPQRGDVILFDELCHASMRDGMGLSKARSFKFPHNDFEALERLIGRVAPGNAAIYVVTESVFSMDGDSPNLEELTRLCEKHNCFLVIDEAHALGVFGQSGCGLVQQNGLHEKCFARLVTFGKGLGCHGAAILGSAQLRDFLVNFARSFIYTTGLPPHAVATIISAYKHLQTTDSQTRLAHNIAHFNREKARLSLKPIFVYGKSAIQSAIIPGNDKAKRIASQLQGEGFDIRAILSPTVPEGLERLRICLHSYNTEAEISGLLENLKQHLF